MDDVAHVSLESVRSVYPSLTRLQCIVELEDFGKTMNRLVSLRVLEVVAVLKGNWGRVFKLPSNHKKDHFKISQFAKFDCNHVEGFPNSEKLETLYGFWDANSELETFVWSLGNLSQVTAWLLCNET